jgi:hypothetical protein
VPAKPLRGGSLGNELGDRNQANSEQAKLTECRSLSLDWWNGLKSALLARFLPINMGEYMNFGMNSEGRFATISLPFKVRARVSLRESAS